MVFELFQKWHLQIYANQCMTSLINPLRFVLLNLEKVERKQKKKTKIWISREWKQLLRWNKKAFFSFWRAIIWWKNKKLMEIADTNCKCLGDIVANSRESFSCKRVVLTSIVSHTKKPLRRVWIQWDENFLIPLNTPKILKFF